MTPHSYAALYYPFIHFKNDDWLKLSALYWDRMGRIVPATYTPDDSPTVKALGNFVVTLEPGMVRPEFGIRFVDFVERNATALRTRYDIGLRSAWNELPEWRRPSVRGGPSGHDKRLGYVYFEKMSPDLRQVMLDANIAMLDDHATTWIGMHPLLADVYMTALADQLADERSMHPLTDVTIHHLAIGGGTIDRVADALLPKDGVGALPGETDTESVAACVAIETVLPKGLSQVPVDRILEFRERYPEERGKFQQYMQGFVGERSWLATARDRKTLEDRLADEYAKSLTPQITELKEKLRDCRIDTITGVMSMKVEVPGIAVGAAALLGVVAAPVGILAGVALAVIPVLRARKKEQQELLRQPLAFLLHAEKDLQPASVATSISLEANQLRQH